MILAPHQITIAVTVYSRRQYVKQAVASALNQTVPVRVIVVEDCGPDEGLQDFVKAEFGSRIEYFRNAARRGIFGNWNVCLEQCRTEWLSILHDDDYLPPNFVATMIELNRLAPGLDLYCGYTHLVNERSERLPDMRPPVSSPWVKLTLKDFFYLPPFLYPGQLFRVSSANRVGRFRESSYCAGDWEMWAKLAAQGGAAQTSELVAYYRVHAGFDKGLNQLYRNGKLGPANILQHKRVLALLPASEKVRFDRVEWQRRSQTSIFFLLERGASLPPRLLRYHVRSLLVSPAPNWRYALFQTATRLLGPGFVKVTSRAWQAFRPSPSDR